MRQSAGEHALHQSPDLRTQDFLAWRTQSRNLPTGICRGTGRSEGTDEVGVPRAADVYLYRPTRFMADMKEALATLGVPPERIHVEIFNGGESMTPGIVGAAMRAPHTPRDDANTGRLVSFARSGITAHWKASA
jgi:ferredoxin-NADP reductase